MKTVLFQKFKFFYIFLFSISLGFCSNAEEERKECGVSTYEFLAFNPGVGACTTYRNATGIQAEERYNLCILYASLYVKCKNKKSTTIFSN